MEPRVKSSSQMEDGVGLSGRLLTELRDAHRRLLAAMQAMERLTQGRSSVGYRRIRFELSSASLRRRILWQRIFRTLASTASAADSQALASLQATDFVLLRASSDHVSAWNGERIDRNWSDYCRASRAIRAKMNSAIMEEKRVLYPMLERHSQRVSGLPGGSAAA